MRTLLAENVSTCTLSDSGRANCGATVRPRATSFTSICGTTISSAPDAGSSAFDKYVVSGFSRTVSGLPEGGHYVQMKIALIPQRADRLGDRRGDEVVAGCVSVPVVGLHVETAERLDRQVHPTAPRRRWNDDA